ncbi:MAG: low-specificity L-threonine aldolase, partial [Candidatus Marinimicrobia bacterium]|nr:low-specificity L-threonine aldolase [Candidatus Neomarinimicrobiota bacterium]
DLRSDTVTRPTAAMRKAMYAADVGDDVYGEDRVMNKLQDQVAGLLGKEAGLFIPSGTMSNQLAIRSQTQPGDEVICDYNAHIFNYEGGGPALLSGVQLHPLNGDHGILDPAEIRSAFRPTDHHYAQTRLIALENTHNRAGGVVYPLIMIEAVAKLARGQGILMHLDGARLMNAVIASGIDPAAYAEPFNSVSLCLSKGLGAPVGSVLVGDADLIEQAHRFRKLFGGGMRQVGSLAAAGLYALENNIERLADDHQRAKELAKTCLDLGVLENDLAWTQTNIVIMNFPKGDTAYLETKFRAEGLLVSVVNDHRIRLVTHLDFNDEQLVQTKQLLKKVLG